MRFRIGWGPGVALVLLGFLVVRSFREHHWPPPSLYAAQAAAWLQGRTDVAPHLVDVSPVEGRAYVPFPPFPSVLVLPLVAATDADRAPIRALAVALALLTIWAMNRLLVRLELDPERRAWLIAGVLLGTGYWMCVVWSVGVWFLAHLVAVALLFLAIADAFSNGSAFRVGLFAGLAFLSRQLAVVSVPFLALVVFTGSAALPLPRRLGRVAALCSAFGVCALAYLAYNQVRFGSPFDTGYGGILLEDGPLKARYARYGLFHLAYVPFNFIHMFLEGLHVEFDTVRVLTPIRVSELGTSLTVASPFLFAAFAAGARGTVVRAAWLTVAIALAQHLLYYNNGWVQMNTQRFALDFIPVLVVLVALGMKRLPPAVWKTAIAWSIALNAFVLAGLPALRRVLSAL